MPCQAIIPLFLGLPFKPQLVANESRVRAITGGSDLGGEINFPRKCERGKIEENSSIRFDSFRFDSIRWGKIHRAPWWWNGPVENRWKNRLSEKFSNRRDIKMEYATSLGSAVSHFSPNAYRQRSFIFMPLPSLSLRKRRPSLTERREEEL